MKLKPIFILALFIACIGNINSQINKNDILFTVEDEPVYASEFLRVYNKNLDLVKDETQKDVDEYFKLFVNYKLKIKEAKALEFDKKKQYLREFQSYKNQLAKNYLTDLNVTNALVEEAYDRISNDVKVSHILMTIPEHEKDTSAIYDQMLVFKERLQNEDFQQLMNEVNNGTTVIAEDLGYFSGFKMVYPFETVAYNTAVGKVSDPFRTSYGYHVLKVFDKRKSRGEVTVGHIMINHQQKDSLVDPEKRINEIYKMFLQGEEFESLAKQFSEDQSSAKNGGRLSTFKSGQLTSVAFEDKAFSLKEIDDVSEPFKTNYGWHIAKLYEKKAIAPFAELKSELEQRVKRDSRSKMITKAFISKLKEQYNIDANIDLSYFVNILNDSIFSQSWKAPKDFPQDKVLVKIGDLAITYLQFVQYIEGDQKRTREVQPFETIIESQYEAFLNAKLLSYHEANLENINEEYAQVLSEYRDGLLLFDLMETKIWNAVKEDSIGLKNYFETHKDKYIWPERIEAIVASGAEEAFINEVKIGLENGMDLVSLKADINKDGNQNVIFTTGLMQVGHQALPENFKFQLGVSKLYHHNNSYHVVKVDKIVPESQRTFEESKGMVINDYQAEFESNWLIGLQNKYKVEIDQSVMNKVKSEINK